MRLKYVGKNPICVERFNNSETEIPDYHPNCCRFPKSCSSDLFEFIPENEVEFPKKVRVKRMEGVGPGTQFDWAIYGQHPNSKGLITLYKFFPTLDAAHNFIAQMYEDGMSIFAEELKNDRYGNPSPKGHSDHF